MTRRKTDLQLLLMLALMLGAAAGMAAPPSTAQTTPPTSTQPTTTADLSEVVVTAERHPERLQDVPVSVAVFNQQDLENENVVDAQDLAKSTPSLSANSEFGPENSSFAIRGFAQDIGTQPTVGLYFADVVAPLGPSAGLQAGNGAGSGNMFDLQSIQVLKGPQGTLFGINTTGGDILLVPNKPSARTEGYVEVSYGNYDMREVQAVLNTPISDTVRFRIAVDDRKRDGYLINDSGIGPARLGNLDDTGVRASLVVDVTPNIENYTIASFSRSDTAGPIQKLIACNPSPSASNLLGPFACAQLAQEKLTDVGSYTVPSDLPNPENLLEQWQVINHTTWHASDSLTVTNIASYAQLRDTLNTALFGTNFPAGPGAPPLIFAASQAIPGGWGTDQSTATEELRAQGSTADRKLTYQGGVYLEFSRPLKGAGILAPSLVSCTSVAELRCTDVLGIGFTQAVGVPINVGSVSSTVEQTSYDDEGVYGQATYGLTDRLKLTGGLRYTWDHDGNTSQLISYSFPVVPPFTSAPAPRCTDAYTAPTCSFSKSESSSAPTGVLDLQYTPSDGVMLYVKYSRGYRAGGVDPQSTENYRTYSPEKLDAYEIGEKTTFGGPVRGIFDVSAFYNDLTNQQLEAGFLAAPGALVAPTTGIINAGKSRIYGAELSTAVTPVTGLTLTANYTYLNTEITSIAKLASTDPNYVISSGIPVGAPLELSPKNKYSISGTYTLPLDRDIGTISLGAIFTHTDRQLTNYDYYGAQGAATVTALGGNLSFVQATNLLDLNMNWLSVGGSPVDLSLFATNVTDRQYYTFIAGLAVAGFETAELGLPRMYGLRVRYSFGH